MFILRLLGEYILFQNGSSSVKIVLSPSEKGATIKVNICHKGENSFLLKYILFRRIRYAGKLRGDTKVVFLVKTMADNLPDESNHLYPFNPVDQARYF